MRKAPGGYAEAPRSCKALASASALTPSGFGPSPSPSPSPALGSGSKPSSSTTISPQPLPSCSSLSYPPPSCPSLEAARSVAEIPNLCGGESRTGRGRESRGSPGVFRGFSAMAAAARGFRLGSRSRWWAGSGSRARGARFLGAEQGSAGQSTAGSWGEELGRGGFRRSGCYRQGFAQGGGGWATSSGAAGAAWVKPALRWPRRK